MRFTWLVQGACYGDIFCSVDQYTNIYRITGLLMIRNENV